MQASIKKNTLSSNLCWLMLAFLQGVLLTSCAPTQPQKPVPPQAIAPVAKKTETPPWVPFRNTSLDGEKLLVAKGHSIEVISWRSNGIALTLSVPKDMHPIHLPTWSPDDTKIMAISGRKALIWDAKDGHILHTLAGHESDISTAMFSPDGSHVATASHDETARIWPLQIGAETAPIVISGQTGLARVAAYSPKGDRLITVENGGNAKIYNPTDGKLIERIPLPEKEHSVLFANFSPSGDQLCMSFFNGFAGIYDLPKKSWVWFKKIAHGGQLYSAVYSPTGAQVIFGSNVAQGYIVDAETGGVSQQIKLATLFHSGFVLFLPSLRGNTLSTSGLYENAPYTALLAQEGSTFKTVRLFFSNPATYANAVLSEDGQHLFALTSHGAITQYELQTGKQTSVVEENPSKIESLVSLPTQPKQPSTLWLFSSTGDQYLQMSFSEGTFPKTTAIALENIDNEFVSAPHMVAKGGNCVGSYYKQHVVIWGQKPFATKTLNVDQGLGAWYSGALSPDCSMAAIATTSKPTQPQKGAFVLALLDVASQKRTFYLPMPVTKLSAYRHPSLQFSHDGKKIYAFTDKNSVETWSTQNGKKSKPTVMVLPKGASMYRFEMGTNKKIAVGYKDALHYVSIQDAKTGRTFFLRDTGKDPFVLQTLLSSDESKLVILTKSRILIVDTTDGHSILDAAAQPDPKMTMPVIEKTDPSSGKMPTKKTGQTKKKKT